MLLLRKVLSSIRIHLIYSAKTGSSQRSFTQFLDMADWQGERRWQSQHCMCSPGPPRNSSGLSGVSKLYKSITANSCFPFSCDEAPSPGRPPVFIPTSVYGKGQSLLICEPSTGSSATRARLWHLLIFPSSSQCLGYIKSWNFRGRMRCFLHTHQPTSVTGGSCCVQLLQDVQGANTMYQIFVFEI